MRRRAIIGAVTLALAASAGGVASAALPQAPGPQGLETRFGVCGVLTPSFGNESRGNAERLYRC